MLFFLWLASFFFSFMVPVVNLLQFLILFISSIIIIIVITVLPSVSCYSYFPFTTVLFLKVPDIIHLITFFLAISLFFPTNSLNMFPATSLSPLPLILHKHRHHTPPSYHLIAYITLCSYNDVIVNSGTDIWRGKYMSPFVYSRVFFLVRSHLLPIQSNLRWNV